MKAENIETRTKPLISVDVLCVLLRFVIQRMKYPQVISIIIICLCWCYDSLFIFCHTMQHASQLLIAHLCATFVYWSSLGWWCVSSLSCWNLLL